MKISNIKRYEIYYAALDPTIGREIQKTRPVVVVSPDQMNRYSDTVVVCPLTTKLHAKWRHRIQINCANKPAEIAVDQIRTISRLRLRKKIDELSSEKAAELRHIIVHMYGE
jgi:mRNA interferase MazF